MAVVTGPDNDIGLTLKEMIDTHQTALLRLCYLYLRDRHLAEDAVQETFIKAAKALQGFRGESSVKTWLTRIAVRTCCDMRRSFWFRRVDRRFTPDMLPEPVTEPDNEDTALTTAVLQLPQKLREVVVLYYYQDMKVNEIADALGVSQPTVSYRLKCAREKLREELGREDA